MFKRNIPFAFQKISEQWLFDLKNYDEDLLYSKPSEKHWCLAELYDHIMRVAKSYQIPNFHKCIKNDIKEGDSKNMKGYLIFDLNVLPYRKIKMESFPTDIVTNFTPENRDRKELIEDFEKFIQEVKKEAELLNNYDKSIRHFHPFFGMINAKEWFSLIEIHMRHHEVQKKRLEALKPNS